MRSILKRSIVFMLPTLVLAFAMALAREMAAHRHLNLYDWAVAGSCAFIIAVVAASPLLPLGPVLSLQKRLPWWIPPILTIAILFSSIASFYITRSLPRDSWSALAEAPESLIRLSGIEPFGIWGGSLYAEGTSGKLYRFNCEDTCGWTETPVPPESGSNPNRYHWCEAQLAEPTLMPISFVEIRERKTSIYCGTDYSITTHLFLDTNGRVWIWQTSNSMGSALGVLVHAIGGLILAILSNLFVYALINRSPRTD